MAFRSLIVQALFRAMLVSAAFVFAFSAAGARAQQTPGSVQGQLTSTEGKINFPFFYGSKVGMPCNPFVDYNCEANAAAIKAAQEAAAKSGKCDPYVDYKCLDTYLGDNVVGRFFRYYQLEWGKAVAPSDPNAPPSARDAAVWPKSPVSAPPMPFVDFPYGGSPTIGTTRPNSVDSPFMVAIANTGLGKWLQDSPHPDLRLGQWRLQPEHQSAAAWRQQPHRVRLHPQHRSTRPSRPLYRAASRHGAKGSRRLGLSLVSALWRELPLHQLLRPRSATSSMGTTRSTAMIFRWSMPTCIFRKSSKA